MTFPKYGKIETLYVRDEETFKVMEGFYRRPEFAHIRTWHLTEKIDGTNVRVHWRPNAEGGIGGGGGHSAVSFGGRTDNAQMPLFLLDHLVETFTSAGFEYAFPEGDAQVTLYGEGYGGKIQKGGNYRKDASFRLFDVLVHGCGNHRAIWLKPEDVLDVANKFGIATAPVVGFLETAEAVKLVRNGFYSKVTVLDGGVRDWMAEGVVARAPCGLLNRLGGRVMWKLKTKDFGG